LREFAGVCELQFYAEWDGAFGCAREFHRDYFDFAAAGRANWRARRIPASGVVLDGCTCAACIGDKDKAETRFSGDANCDCHARGCDDIAANDRMRRVGRRRKPTATTAGAGYAEGNVHGELYGVGRRNVADDSIDAGRSVGETSSS